VIEAVYLLAALLLGAAAWRNLRARRWARAAFWGLLTVAFAAGDAIQAAAKAGERLPHQAVGAGVIALALLAAFGMRALPATQTADPGRAASAARLGHRLFMPALLIPALTAALVLLAKIPGATALLGVAREQVTLVALATACLLALIAALRVTGARPAAALAANARLLDTLGWAVVLPALLAALGNVFAATHVGDAIAALTQTAIPVESRLASLVAYALGMLVFTIIMGNAFAAFPVLAAGIALPLLIGRHGADPAALGALGMLSGYCGTLLTPMAANFNIVPAALLELRDPYGVIRAQWPTALGVFLANFLLMWLFALR